jgi:hypothetical protein
MLENLNWEMGLISIFIIVIGVVFGIKTIRELREKKKGLTIEDERSRKVKLVAGARAFQASIWFMFILMWLVNVLEIIKIGIEQIFGVAILGMGIVFGVCWLWANRQDV